MHSSYNSWYGVHQTGPAQPNDFPQYALPDAAAGPPFIRHA